MSAPTDKMINIGGNQQYLQVQHRVLWLRGQVGAAPDAQIVTEIVTLDVERQYAVVKAIVSIPNGGTATAHGSALASDLKRGQGAKFLEFAETRAVGRALAMLGYSTAGAQDLDEDGPDAPVDAPLQANGRQQPAQKPTAANGGVSPAALAIISSRREALGWTAEQVRELWTARGLPARLADFDEAQARELVAALDEKLGEIEV
jgi:hypothetical protein